MQYIALHTISNSASNLIVYSYKDDDTELDEEQERDNTAIIL